MKAFKIYTAAVASFALCASVPLTPAFAARTACDILAPTTCGNGAWATIGFYSQEQCVASVEAECNTPGGGGNPVLIIPGPRNDCNSNPVECGMNSHGDY